VACFLKAVECAVKLQQFREHATEPSIHPKGFNLHILPLTRTRCVSTYLYIYC
jgi:hypothetical protein